jgi:hypothetical protein
MLGPINIGNGDGHMLDALDGDFFLAHNSIPAIATGAVHWDRPSHSFAIQAVQKSWVN